MAAPRIASERLFLTADKTKVVLEADPEARILLAAAGSEIPSEYADLDIPAKFLRSDDKAVDPPADKAVKKAANK